MDMKRLITLTVVGTFIIAGCAAITEKMSPAPETEAPAPAVEEATEPAPEPAMEEAAEPAEESAIEEAAEPAEEPATEEAAEPAPESGEESTEPETGEDP